MLYIEMGGNYIINDKKCFGRKIYVPLTKKPEIRKRFNNTDVYATIFQYDKEDQNLSNIYGPMYLDLDMELNNNEEYLKLVEELKRIVTYLNLQYNIPSNYIKFYFTGKKGFHLIIPAKVFNIEPNNKLNLYYKEIARELDKITILPVIDLKIYDKKRLFRLPNSINGKTGLYKVPISYGNIINFNYEEIKKYASCERIVKFDNVQPIDKAIKKLNDIKIELQNLENTIKKNRVIPKNVNIANIKFPDCIKTMFNEGSSKGNRNNTTVILSSALFQKGIDCETGLKIISKWNFEKNDPCLSEDEIKKTVLSAYQQVQAGRRHGCSSIKDMGLCVGKQCKIYK